MRFSTILATLLASLLAAGPFAATAQEKAEPPPAVPAKPAPEKPKGKEEKILEIKRTAPADCDPRPVMTDDDSRAAGRPPPQIKWGQTPFFRNTQ